MVKLNLTLNEIWEKCLEMWKSLARNSFVHILSIPRAKDVWLAENGHNPNEIRNGCFFCHYASENESSDGSDGYGCDACPAKLVDRTFSCYDPKHGYHQPAAFYRRLLELDKIRRSNV